MNIIVEISGYLLKVALTTGYEIEHTRIIKGLPEDAVLNGASVNSVGNLELCYYSESEGGQEGSERRMIIELQRVDKI